MALTRYIRSKGFVQVIDGDTVKLKGPGDGVPGSVGSSIVEHAQGGVYAQRGDQLIVQRGVLLQHCVKELKGKLVTGIDDGVAARWQVQRPGNAG